MTTSDITFVSIGLIITALTLAVWLYLLRQEHDYACEKKPRKRFQRIGIKYTRDDIANLLEAKIRESSRGFVPPHNVLSTKKAHEVVAVALSFPDRFKVRRAKYRGQYISLKNK